MSDNETGLSPAAASRSRAVEGLALSIDLYDRVHAEIDAGKHWSNIDCGSATLRSPSAVEVEHRRSATANALCPGAQ